MTDPATLESALNWDRLRAAIAARAKTKTKATAPDHPPSHREVQAYMEERGIWPWRAIPEKYRLWGKPDKAVHLGALESLATDAKRDRVLTLCGPVGVGKTTQACKLVAWMATTRIRTFKQIIPWDDDAIAYASALQMGWTTEDEITALSERAFLVLDDLSGNITQAGVEKTLRILEARISKLRPTVITTTLTIGKIAARESALNAGAELGLSSRLMGGTIVTMTGEDRRMK